jgi:hypothetical protein
MQFIHSFQAEWLKKKGSLAYWLVIIGGFFTAMIIIVARLIKPASLKVLTTQPNYWKTHWQSSWEAMAIMLLPLGVILASSLVTQLEFKNNAWKQVHTSPQYFTTIFFAKLAVIIVMMLQFFAFFNIGFYMSGIIPPLLLPGITFPGGEIPVLFFLKQNAFYLLDCLPIIALQYLISLLFKNFLVPVGTGLLCWIGALAALRWDFAYLVPYSYTSLYFLKTEGKLKMSTGFHLWALGYFLLFIIAGYCLYAFKKEKG